MEGFDFDHRCSLKRDVVSHLGTLDFITAKDTVVFLGPPGTGKTHLSVGLGRGGEPVLPLVSSRYGRASLIVTSNKPFGRWGEVFDDDVVAAAMIDRLVHHAEVILLKGDSYRLKTATSAASLQPRGTTEGRQPRWVSFQPDHPGAEFSRS